MADSRSIVDDKTNTVLKRYYLETGIDSLSKCNYLESILHFTSGLIYDPESAVIYFNRACAYGMLGDSQAALDDVNRAINMKQSDVLDDYTIIKMYVKKMDYCDQLGLDIKKELNLDSNHPLLSLSSSRTQFYLYRAEILEKCDLIVPALFDYHRAFQLDNEDKEILSKSNRFFSSHPKLSLFNKIKTHTNKDQIIDFLADVTTNPSPIRTHLSEMGSFENLSSFLFAWLVPAFFDEVCLYQQILINKRIANVRRAARILDQGSRDDTSNFSRLPPELNVLIASYTDPTITKGVAYDAAYNNYSRPPL